MSDHEAGEPGVRWDFKVSDQVSGWILRFEVCHEANESVRYSTSACQTAHWSEHKQLPQHVMKEEERERKREAIRARIDAIEKKKKEVVLKTEGGVCARAEGATESRSGEEDSKILQPTAAGSVVTESLLMSKFNL